MTKQLNPLVLVACWIGWTIGAWTYPMLREAMGFGENETFGVANPLRQAFDAAVILALVWVTAKQSRR